MKDGKSRNSSTPDVRIDASRSRTYLTRNNYSGPRLLQNIRGCASPSTSAQSEPPHLRSTRMENLQDDDIMAPPMSSDEDEVQLVAVGIRSDNVNGTKRKAGDADRPGKPHKRTKVSAKPTRRSKRTNDSVEPEPVPESSMSIPDFLGSSQSSQQKRRKAQYGKSSTYSRPLSGGASFADPGEVPSTPQKPKPGTFKHVGATPKSRKRTSDKRLKQIEIPSLAEKVGDKAAAFRIPEGLGLAESSSNSTDLSKGFETGDSPTTYTRKRASSTSSLSSVDSIASYELDQRQKDDLGTGVASQEPIPKGFIRCPLCRRIVDLFQHTTKPDPDSMSLRKQQTFCHTHRVRDATADWRHRGYPVIDWEALEKKRIPKHLAHLRQVLYHKAPSFYLDDLETKLKELRGNQSKIRRYLANEIMEVVKTGYYGPKGAKVMGNKITAGMTNHLKRSLKTDETVRTVGVSGFVSAVLLPELLLRIITEDLGIKDEDEARGVVGESTECGMLLWPDDDHVVQDDDDNVKII